MTQGGQGLGCVSRPTGHRAASSPWDREPRWPGLYLRYGGAQRVRPEDLAKQLPSATSQGKGGLRWGHFDCEPGLARPPDGNCGVQYDFERSGAGCGQGRALH